MQICRPLACKENCRRRGKSSATVLLIRMAAFSRQFKSLARLMLLFRLTPRRRGLRPDSPAERALRKLRTAGGFARTARNQLKAIFNKTETSREAELVVLLWRVSNLAISASLVPRG